MNKVNKARTHSGWQHPILFTFVIVLIIGVAFNVYAGKDDCTNIDGDGAVPISEVIVKISTQPMITMKSLKRTTVKVLSISP